MITFWTAIPIKFDDYRFYKTLLSMYDPDHRTFKIKILTIHKPSTHDLNIYMVPVTSKNINPLGGIINFNIENDSKNIAYAVNEGMDVYIDHSWEEYNLDTFTNGHIYKEHWDYIKKNNIKLLCNNTNHKQLTDAYAKGAPHPIQDYEDFVVPFDLFQYDVRICNAFSNQHWQLNTAPSLDLIDKEYFFSMFVGELQKSKNIILLSELFKRGLDKKSAYSAFKGFNTNDTIRYKGQRTHLINHHSDNSTIKYFLNNEDYISKTRLFERYDKGESSVNIPTTGHERRMPQVAYNSHLYLAAETQASWDSCFYTEKTYKPIAAGMPFIILGSYKQNQILKSHYGYEIFDDIIDYSFENTLERNSPRFFLKYTEDLFDEIERLIKEGPKIFYQQSVKEKIEYNKNLFLNRTTTDAFINDVRETFFKVKDWDVL